MPESQRSALAAGNQSSMQSVKLAFQQPHSRLVSGLHCCALPCASATRSSGFQVICYLQALENLFRGTSDHADEHYKAFYSTAIGGITTDVALMVVPMDDHLVHRGHGVFDTVLVVDGYMYQLPEHLERLEMSAETAGVSLPYSLPQMGRIALETAAVGQVFNGKLMPCRASTFDY